jgi:HEAT repeat protein
MSETIDSQATHNQQADPAIVQPLLERLSSRDGLQRQEARHQLVDMGRPVVPYLIKTLQSPNERMRWEAAKALGEIRDPMAAPALVQALEDDEAAIRWLSATGLIIMGRGALPSLLEALEGHSDSIWMREGAHRVLHALVRDGVADDMVPVLEALEDLEPSVEVPVTAYNALRKIRRDLGLDAS